MSGTPVINDVNIYNAEMKKSLIDKIFFFDKVDAQVYVDFGCADGQLIKFMQSIFPEFIYIGYDIAEDQIELAKKNAPEAEFFSTMEELKQKLNVLYYDKGKQIAVICNSVIHEIYNYSSAVEILDFWSDLKNKMYKYIIIRDMCVSNSSIRQSDPLSVLKIRQRFNSDKLAEFESHWGSINENWSLVHFLLKYRYEANWESEVKENYLPLNFEKLLTNIGREYEPIFAEHYTLPFIRRRVEQDFNIQLQDRTHVKLIFENKK